MAEIFLHPLTWSVLLLATGILTWNRLKVSRWLSTTALLLLVVFSSPIGSGSLLRSLESQNPDIAITALPPAQAIVVLGGAIHAPTSQHANSGLINPSDRLLHALRLYRAGKAPVLMCSGGARVETPEALVMSRLLQEWGVPSEAILLEDRSRSTRENAMFSFQILSARGIRHILLVTSALHMPRAAAVFRKAGFDVTPAPADFRTGWGQGGGGDGGGVVSGFVDSLSDYLPDAGDLMWSDRALKEWIGIEVYRIRGWV